jgi:pyrroloquinoline quinone (PQQ) biosynthesis protein C
MYQARLSVVLSECDDQTLANAELERAMQELGFKRSEHHFEGVTDLASNILLAVVSDHVFSKLRRAKVTVWVSSLTPRSC